MDHQLGSPNFNFSLNDNEAGRAADGGMLRRAEAPRLVRSRLVVVCVLAILFLLSSSANAAEQQVIHAGSELEFRPYCFTDANGKPAGLGPELLQAVADRMGLRLQLTTGPWDKVWSDLVAGNIDVLPIVARTPGREPLVDFSLPHTETFDAFFVREGRPPIKDLAGATGKQIVVLREDAAHHQLVERKFAGKIVPVESIPDGLRLIAAGQHDAFLCSKLIGTLELQQAGIRGITAGPVIPDYHREFSFAVRKAQTELVEKLDQGLRIVKADGTYDRLYRKWLGVEQPPAPWWQTQFWRAMGILGVLVLIGLTWSVARRVLAADSRPAPAPGAFWRYALAVLAVVVGYVVRAGLEAWVGPGQQLFTTFYPAIMIAALLGGFGPGLLATVLSAAVVDIWILPPVGQFTLGSPTDLLALALFFAASLFLTAVAELYRRNRAKAAAVDRAEVLRASEERLRLTLQASEVGTFEIDLLAGEGRWNAVEYELLGLQPGDAPANPETFFRFVHPEDVAELRAQWEEATRTGRLDTEFRVIRADGQHRWLAGKGQFAFAETADTGNAPGKRLPLRFLGVNFDITARKTAEAAVAAAHQQLQSIIDNTTSIIYAFDLEERFVLANAAVAKVLNTTPAQLLGNRRHEFMPQADADWHEANDRKAIAAGTALEFEEHNELPGRSITWLTTKFPLRDAQGKIYAVAGISADISERKQAEAALVHANSQLREADKRKDEFLAMLAHELRNPLAPVRYAIELLRMAGLPEEARQRQQAIIDRQITHMARLLDELLDVSRVTRGKVELRREPLVLEDVMARAADTARPACEALRQDLRFTLPAPDLRVDADPDRLTQAIGNLLINASKFTGEGGRIWLEAEREGDQAVIRVRDNGVGIAPELLPRIFDLFVQADNPLHRSQGGLGIGLTLVRSLVELHGGTVEARSAGEGQGSEFIIRLPALPAGAAEEPELQPAGSPESGQPCRRILVVDDIVDSAASLAELLTMWGHETRAVHDGFAAIETARAWHPEIVLLDIGMPGIDGYETARRLRAEHGRNGLKIVALTGFGQEADRAAANDAGFNAHLVKPVALAQLREMLARLSD